ncbi:MAG: hypothetical protein OEZ58_03605 [Gammaproteobacteria bacterium]|nr:hypothetical protein [Gammaproteobacteria bacterium]MDH5728049.1 hypothetical protein [Gammaproteobacteria bacterium]
MFSLNKQILILSLAFCGNACGPVLNPEESQQELRQPLYRFLVSMKDLDEDPLHIEQNHKSHNFIIATTDTELAQLARAQISVPDSQRSHINGRLLRNDGGFNHAWSWHIGINEWVLAEISIELCDADPYHIEENLESYMAQFEEGASYYCPWGSSIAAELPAIEFASLNPSML